MFELFKKLHLVSKVAGQMFNQVGEENAPELIGQAGNLLVTDGFPVSKQVLENG